MKPKIHFITYGDKKKYSISTQHIISLAKESNFFETYKSYTKNDLSYDFIKKYQNILSQERGGGFYLWKPWIIKNALEKLNNNEFIVYSDSGSSFNYYAKKRFFEYIDMLYDSEFGNFRFESPKKFLEKYWTSKKLFDYFNLDFDSNEGNSPQLMGGHLIFQKNDHTDNFLNEFFKIIDHDHDLITDNYGNSELKNFQENRHDQSILSLLTKSLGGVFVENETFFSPNCEEQKSYPFLSVRNYGHGTRDRIKFKLNIKNIKKTPVYF